MVDSVDSVASGNKIGSAGRAERGVSKAIEKYRREPAAGEYRQRSTQKNVEECAAQATTLAKLASVWPPLAALGFGSGQWSHDGVPGQKETMLERLRSPKDEASQWLIQKSNVEQDRQFC